MKNKKVKRTDFDFLDGGGVWIYDLKNGNTVRIFLYKDDLLSITSFNKENKIIDDVTLRILGRGRKW